MRAGVGRVLAGAVATGGPGRIGRLAGLVALTVFAGCGPEHEFEPPDREARVQEAESLYTAALFDSVTWESGDTRAIEGNIVFSSKCRQCHGPLGRGDTEYAAARGLETPSLVAPDWPYAEDLDAVRRRIFTGHPEGMPTWGVAGITPREIDAVAYYIVKRLRPEVLGGEGAGG